MIRIAPDTDAGRLLRRIVDYPGEDDAAEHARHMWPPPRLADHATYQEWRAARLAWTSTSSARASRLASRLQEAGLVATAGGPRVADWHLARVERWVARGYSVERAHERALATCLLGSGADAAPGVLRLVRRAVEISPGSCAALLGPRPSGRAQATYRLACRLGILIPPSRRTPTEAGLDLVMEWDLQAVAAGLIAGWAS